MSNEMALFGNNQQGPMQLPAHLQGQGLGVSTQLMAAIGEIRNRIGLKGNRFRQVIAGQEMGVWDENYLDVIIVGVVPTLSRLYYAGKYNQGGDNQPPTCYSVNNITPADDVNQKQSDKCDTCPMNIKGSRITEGGQSTKACSYFRRLAILLPGDDTLYMIDVKAMGLFGESKKNVNQFNLNDYAKFLNANGVDASQLVTRLSFDTDESVPKLLFKPMRYISADELLQVRGVAETGQIDDYLVINMKTVDISKEQSSDAPAEEVEEYQEPVQTQAPPARQPAPAARQTAPAPQRTTTPATAPAPRQAAPAQRTAAPAATQAPRPTAPAAQAAPAQRTAAPAQRTAAPAQRTAAPTPTRPAPSRPAQNQLPIDDGVSQDDAVPVEVGSDDEMQSILNDLGL